MAIIDLLVKLRVIDDRQHDAVLSRAHSGAGGAVVQQVAELGYATEGAIARALCAELGLPRLDFSAMPPEPAAVALLDGRTCTGNFVLPVALRENAGLLWLAMADPTDQDAIGLVRRRTQKRVRPAVATPTEILRAVRSLYAAPSAADGLSAIDLAEDTSERFDVVNVSEDLDDSPLSRIEKQLGVRLPESLGASSAPRVPPPADADRAAAFEELFAMRKPGPPVAMPALSEDDLRLVEALRTSLEKGAVILRAVAELCVEKRVFTREEMRKR